MQFLHVYEPIVCTYIYNNDEDDERRVFELTNTLTQVQYAVP